MTDSTNAAPPPHQCAAEAERARAARTASITATIQLVALWLLCAGVWLTVLMIRPGDNAMITNVGVVMGILAVVGTVAVFVAVLGIEID